MQKNEYSKFATPIKSDGRIFNEKTSLLRSPYQRDRDRIVHSTAFRRLKHKTQVFVNTTGDHYGTRITHSIEVSQVDSDTIRNLIYSSHQLSLIRLKIDYNSRFGIFLDVSSPFEI